MPALSDVLGVTDAAVQLQSGEVLAIQSRAAQRIDPDAGDWHSGRARWRVDPGAAALLANGRVLSVSGSSEPASIYDPARRARASE